MALALAILSVVLVASGRPTPRHESDDRDRILRLPPVFDGVDDSMHIARDEIIGPVMSVLE